MAKPNYAFEKRQRELAKKKKKEEKAARKAQPRPPTEDGAAGEPAEGHPDEVAGDGDTTLDAADDVQPTEPSDPDRSR